MIFGHVAQKVLEQRYLARDHQGNIVETPEEMFRRVAKFIASADTLFGATEEEVKETEQSFYDLLTSFRFLPNTPTLINAGRPLGQLSACFVIKVDDSVEGIFQAVKEGALIMKTGGGIGMSLSHLRPVGSIVKSTGQPASGPLSFMRVFDVMCETIAQGGVRRGAMMGVLWIDHPDILLFIDAKADKKTFRNFNLSVGITGDFMEALFNSSSYPLVDPQTGEIKAHLDANEVFNRIATRAWETGDPGVLFIDRAKSLDPVDGEEIESTNPCGEQFLAPYDSCNLGSINLKAMLKRENGSYHWDFELFKKTIFEAVHFLDNVIEVNKYPVEAIKEKTQKNRRIGLGVMGWADALSLLGLPYDSEEAIEEAKKISRYLSETSADASTELAKLRGPFPAYEKSRWKTEGRLMRNAATTTVAPTGSLSILAGVAGGVEPFFALAYKRSITAGDFNEIVPTLVEDAELKGYDADLLVEQIINQGGSLRKVENAPEELKKCFPVSYDIDSEWHVKMQGAWQTYIHNSISKTVNLPRNATVEDVKKIYLLAYQEGCKGVTIYRDGSLDTQVLMAPRAVEESDKKPLKRIFPERPRILRGFTRKYRSAEDSSLYVTVNLDENCKPVEVFASLSGAGAPAELEAIARLTSISLQYGIPIEVITDQLDNPLCPVTYKLSPDGLRSVANGISRALKEIISRENHNRQNHTPTLISPVLTFEPLNKDDGEDKYKKIEENGKKESGIETVIAVYGKERGQAQLEGRGVKFCPECSDPLSYQEGCPTCYNCGWTKCS
ncbi:MAG: Vitamin B12-dependent ribonucleoside-diphosphate reductase [candidate division WS2 bacterium]|nr:Vitamin B12-dependent ribonucleoside-diphosphate reductase [Candidatus Lithacetigena glycinireducens]